jgi:hypothetical protein
MKYKFHVKLSNGFEDSIIIEGNNIEEINIKKEYEFKKRGVIASGSERIDDIKYCSNSCEAMFLD